jgi:hypothetical protein
MKTIQVIKYNDKEYKLPFAVGLSDDPTTLETIANRFSGEEGAAATVRCCCL